MDQTMAATDEASVWQICGNRRVTWHIFMKVRQSTGTVAQHFGDTCVADACARVEHA
jgi:hypothetical protein